MSTNADKLANPPREFELFDSSLPVRRYKLILQTFLQRRGSGARQAIAEALGITRSFVTQITSPAYDLPIPPRHVTAIVRLADLDASEERTFIGAYLHAHPERAGEVQGHTARESGSEVLTLVLPQLGSPAAQRRLVSLVERFALDVASAMIEQEAEAVGPLAKAQGRKAPLGQ